MPQNYDTMTHSDLTQTLLSVQNVSMSFQKYRIGVDSLKELVVRVFKHDLQKNKFQCLENVSFQIDRGEAVALIGKNGAGKSTLLKIVCGILPPEHGNVRCNGRITPLLRLGAGFDSNADGIENIYLNAAILGYTKKEIDDKMPAILEFSIVNEGSDIAKDVRVDMIWPAGMIPSDSLSTVGDIAPGATRLFKRAFVLDSTVAPSAQHSIVASITEFTGKHKDIKYFLFETGKMNMEVNLMTGQTPAAPSYYSQMQDIMLETADGKTIERSELLTGLTQTATPDIYKYALIIGNEDYNSFKQQTLYEPNVDFATNDADAFKEYAVKIVGVPEENIIMLKNATYSQMKFNINKLARIAGIYPGNVELYVYYAGHGQVDGKSKESFLIVSTTAPSEGIRLEDLYATISGSGCKRAMMFLDACYSGMGRGIIIQPKKTPVSGNMVVMTASSATQRSMPYEEKKHGMFTYFLLKKLKDTSGDITIEELFNDVKANVQSNSVWINDSEQTPELISGPGIDENWKSWKL